MPLLADSKVHVVEHDIPTYPAILIQPVANLHALAVYVLVLAGHADNPMACRDAVRSQQILEAIKAHRSTVNHVPPRRRNDDLGIRDRKDAVELLDAILPDPARLSEVVHLVAVKDAVHVEKDQ
jgi:hypothetical protein